ncbi:PilW family protein [Variovorax sp. J22G73]|uniref:PilW family protein n=1 Tax=unclassified Variovorax TaxID=663243 RepID=UPI000D5C6603|nr:MULTISPECIES: PilW family protein [unclassified Variovorax]MDM0009118.1 PilW family protein [Variovorax sp. J22R203]MDM0101625.1 PilW family protein [Variovorax sp. J22G73]
MRKDDMHPRSHSWRDRARRQHGVSLIELMVGLVVGLVCVLIIVQLQTLWDARKRSVGSGNDAQISGTLGAFALDRDLRLAGFGFGTAGGDPADPTTSAMGCTVKAFSQDLAAPTFTFKLAPVQIIKADGKPDEIRVLYGNSSYFVSSQPIMSSTAESNSLKSREGFLLGDKAIAANPATGSCNLVEITGLSSSDPNAVEHKEAFIYTTNQGLNKTATMNKAGGTGTDITSGVLFNLGMAPALTVWKVNPSRQSLTRYNSLFEDEVNASDVVTDVVTLKAQYGYDASGDGVIGTGEWYDTLPGPTPNYARLLAVRFGLLIRSRQFERPNVESGTAVPVTASAPKWANGSIAFPMRNVDNTDDSGDGASAINGDAAANNWRNYRYRVYDTVVPLRNMIWGVTQ